MITLELKDFNKITLNPEAEEQAKICMVIGYVLDHVIPEMMVEGVTSIQVANKIKETFDQYGITTLYNFIIDSHKIHSHVHISYGNILTHGVPSDIPFKNGQVVRVDLVGFRNGVYGDSARSFMIGELNSTFNEMLQFCEELFVKVVSKIGIDNNISDISKIFDKEIKKSAYFSWTSLNSHIVGAVLHGPTVLNFENKLFYQYYNRMIGDQTIIALEPMISDKDTKNSFTHSKIDENIYLAEGCENNIIVHQEHAILFTSAGNFMLDKHYNIVE